jgi:hypothetical protein
MISCKREIVERDIQWCLSCIYTFFWTNIMQAVTMFEKTACMLCLNRADYHIYSMHGF